MTLLITSETGLKNTEVSNFEVMAKYIKLFKSFEEQEKHHLEEMAYSTPKERFRRLYLMQQITNRLHHSQPSRRKIVIDNGPPEYEFLLFLKCAQENQLRYLLKAGML